MVVQPWEAAHVATLGIRYVSECCESPLMCSIYMVVNQALLITQGSGAHKCNSTHAHAGHVLWPSLSLSLSEFL